MKFTWNEDKVFEGATFTFEDTRFNYSEQRFITVGLLGVWGM